MGRGRAKAKQTKVARELKYNTGGTDLDRLRQELVGSSTTDDERATVDDEDDDEDDDYADPYADLYDDEDDEDDEPRSGGRR